MKTKSVGRPTNKSTHATGSITHETTVTGSTGADPRGGLRGHVPPPHAHHYITIIYYSYTGNLKAIAAPEYLNSSKTKMLANRLTLAYLDKIV